MKFPEGIDKELIFKSHSSIKGRREGLVKMKQRYLDTEFNALKYSARIMECRI